MNELQKIQQIAEYKGIKNGTYFYISAKYFGKDCQILYKVIGFDPDKNLVYVNRRNKKTMKINGNSAIFEAFNCDALNDLMKNNLLWHN